MKTRVEANEQRLSKPASGPITRSLLQRKPGCRQNCACSSCGGKAEASLRRWPNDSSNRIVSEPRLGHDFSRVRVVAPDSEPLQFSGSSANSAQLSIKGQLQADESSSSEEVSDNFAEPSAESGSEPLESPVETGNSTCPITAVFSSTLAGGEKANCRVPDKEFGAATLARFVLRGVEPGAKSQTVTEQFKKLSDNYGVFSRLKPNSFTTSGNIFDDCYMLASPNALPSDLELKVEQNHLLKGQIISKNIVTFMPDRISIRACKRVKGSCDFATVCRK